jgi:D-arginine dehydrogenase
MPLQDFVVIGAGIAGTSVAYRLAEHASVTLLERESQPGYHSTGRSAALFMETYGTANIQALTRAGRDFYEHPPAGFTDTPILTPRGVLYIAREDQMDLLQTAYQEALARSPNVELVDGATLLAEVPCLRPEAAFAGMREIGAADIDVNALHQGYLRGLRQRGGVLRTKAEVTAITRIDQAWEVTLGDGSTVHARKLVNAAGAWADVIAGLAGVRPIGLEPRRRTAFIFAAPEGMATEHWPSVIGIDETFYFKPDAGLLLGSPANADPTFPHDVVPEELDVATGIHHIEQATTLSIRRPRNTWAGLRSFVADGDLVVGFDADQTDFFWLAAQGGYGIQSAAGASLLAKNLLLGEALDKTLIDQGVDVPGLDPARLR